MSDLIRRQDAFRAVLGVTTYDTVDDVEIHCDASVCDSEGWLGGIRDALRAIEDVPSAEPERKKGKWVKIGHWGRHYRCDQCGNTLDFDGVNAGRGDANFCPNCGADLRGE